MADDVTCATCRFFRGDKRQGACVRYPPQVFTTIGRLGEAVIGSASAPVRGDTIACGEYAGRIAAA